MNRLYLLLLYSFSYRFYFYLRNLMRQLEAMEKEFENNDIENAKKILSDLIQDTKDSIED